MQPPEHLAWLAQGVRQHILLRVLPVQRHDALGPLSVARMALALAQRRLTSAPPALQGLADRVAEVDAHVRDAVTALGRLRWWDSTHQPPRPWPEVVTDSCHLLQLAISQRGHTLQLGPLWTDGPAPVVATPTGHLAVLGLLLQALDHHADLCCAWQLGGQGRQLRLDCRPLPAATSAPMAEPAAARLSFEAYQWLMADTGWQVCADDQGWTLTAPPITPEPTT